MEQSWWDLFRETGDALCYLLYRAEERERESEAESAPAAKEAESGPQT